MRIPSGSARQSRLRFNITPLIDVVFLLIIFFLVASHFVRNEAARPVELPVALQAAGDESTATERLTITVSPAGEFSVTGRPITLAGIQSRIRTLAAAAGRAGRVPEVRIRADRRADCRPVREVLQACAAEGIADIQFAVREPQDSDR